MSQRETEPDDAVSAGAIQTGVVVLEVDRSVLQTLVREQYTIAKDGDLSVLLYINGGNADSLDIGRENDVDAKCNVSIGALGRLLRGDTVFWSEHSFNGRPLVIDSTGVNLDPIHSDAKSENLLKQDGW